MIPFFIGTIMGSFLMLFTMSLMFIARRADDSSEMMLNDMK
ncbi:DUF3789 domain-containing protein [Pseudoneobacillus sp. C159]